MLLVDRAQFRLWGFGFALASAQWVALEVGTQELQAHRSIYAIAGVSARNLHVEHQRGVNRRAGYNIPIDIFVGVLRMCARKCARTNAVSDCIKTVQPFAYQR